MEPRRPGDSDSTGGSGITPGPVKRQYEPPRILYREPLEAMAAVCAPTPPAKGSVAFCSQGPISS